MSIVAWIGFFSYAACVLLGAPMELTLGVLLATAGGSMIERRQRARYRLRAREDESS